MFGNGVLYLLTGVENVDANGDAGSGDAGNGVNDNGDVDDDDGNLDTNGDGVYDKGNANGEEDGNRDTNGDGLNDEVNVNGDWCDLHYLFPHLFLQNYKNQKNMILCVFLETV